MGGGGGCCCCCYTFVFIVLVLIVRFYQYYPGIMFSPSEHEEAPCSIVSPAQGDDVAGSEGELGE